ncbi:PREDICTED: uncharacterized protein LOC101307180 isoform X1 [Fragaria vesca subsp. vesca]|uniref:uncharacterized protein LOC101307180 isoform X1 n=1 Tax=Fragaria vesca subsp. vesca TaxID=101020 RepID=UPI0002C2EFED|nr:PREDICTED: uncharacterized protein LOC101307180 isoform X1 [Fragaria vesca subsp. vesca]
MMDFKKEFIDVVLVPAGLLIMLIYHLFLLYKYFHQPLSTSMGYENNDQRIWVTKILEVQGDNVSRGLGVISSNTSAAMTLASISLTLSSLIGVWISNLPSKFFPIQMIYGNTSPSMNSIKYICLLTSFLLAFSFFVQSARHFIHSNYLLSTPGVSDKRTVKKVERAVQRGSEFWALGLRALYFGLNIMLWFFGPIPMFASSVLMVVILYCHDIRKSEYDNLHDVLLIY